VKNLADRAVVYLNVDLAVEGQESMRAEGVPLLYSILYDVAKRVSYTNHTLHSLFDYLTIEAYVSELIHIPVVHLSCTVCSFFNFVQYHVVRYRFVLEPYIIKYIKLRYHNYTCKLRFYKLQIQ